MDQERSEIREVEDARRRVAEDVRSVAENANVVERAKETAQNKIDDAKEMVSGRMQDARSRLETARDSMVEMGQKMRSMSPAENPMGMLLAGLAIGFLVGMVLPVSRFESERIGPLTDDMKDRMRQAGSEAVRRGSEVIRDTIDAGREAATTSIREQTRDIGLE